MLVEYSRYETREKKTPKKKPSSQTHKALDPLVISQPTFRVRLVVSSCLHLPVIEIELLDQ